MDEKDIELNIEVTVELENDKLEDEWDSDGLEFLEDDDLDEFLEELEDEDELDQAVQVTTNVFMSTW